MYWFHVFPHHLLHFLVIVIFRRSWNKFKAAQKLDLAHHLCFLLSEGMKEWQNTNGRQHIIGKKSNVLNANAVVRFEVLGNLRFALVLYRFINRKENWCEESRSSKVWTTSIVIVSKNFRIERSPLRHDILFGECRKSVETENLLQVTNCLVHIGNVGDDMIHSLNSVIKGILVLDPSITEMRKYGNEVRGDTQEGRHHHTHLCTQ